MAGGTYLLRADWIEEQRRGVGQHHMPKVRVRQAAALELEPHKMGGGLEVRGTQLFAQCRVHAIAHDSQVGSRNVLFVITCFVEDASHCLPVLPLLTILCK